ncbi:MAG: hypothetical protein V8S88_03605 [Lachnospiraceae bacterium]
MTGKNKITASDGIAFDRELSAVMRVWGVIVRGDLMKRRIGV